MLKAGILGLPNVGKSTLFNAISSTSKAQASNYRFCTIEPNVGLVNVPDKRLEQLASLVNPQKVIPTQLEIADIAGLVKGASQGEGLGNRFLANIREVDALIHVVRCFEDQNVLREEGAISPRSDRDIIDTELQLKDLESVDKKIIKLSKQVKSGDKLIAEELDALHICKKCLEQGKNLRTLEDEKIRSSVRNNFFLTVKPTLYVANVDELSIHSGNAYSSELVELAQAEQSSVIIMNNSLEAQISELEDLEERKAFMEMYNMDTPVLDRLVQSVYDLLGLQTFFTVGEAEVRAWTIEKKWKAPQAAGVIHSDFEKGFIKAEVIAYEDFVSLQSELACKENGKLRIEGKAYEMKDGDIVHFRFNV